MKKRLFWPCRPGRQILLISLLLVTLADLVGQSASQWQVRSGWARFFPDNEYHNQVVNAAGILSSVYEDIPVVDGLAVGLGFQKTIRPKLAIEGSWFYTQAQKEITEWYWRRQARNGVDLTDVKTTTTHSLQMTWLNLQVFFQQHWKKGGVLELGMGLGGSWNRQYFRSGFIYNERLGQMDSEEYTRRRTFGAHLPMSVRSSFPLNKRWVLGVETTGMVFFNEAQLLVYLGACAQYRI